MKNPYDELGVAEDAPAAAIADRFHVLALLLHPDRGGDQALFVRLSGAYDEVKTPYVRARTDARLREWRTAQVEAVARRAAVVVPRKHRRRTSGRNVSFMPLRTPRTIAVVPRRVPMPFSDLAGAIARSRPRDEVSLWFLGGLFADIAWAARRR